MGNKDRPTMERATDTSDPTQASGAGPEQISRVYEFHFVRLEERESEGLVSLHPEALLEQSLRKGEAEAYPGGDTC